MSTYQYIVEVNDKASNFINQFTKTLDKVNERFGSNRIQGTEAFESMQTPLEKVNQVVNSVSGGLEKFFSIGSESGAAITTARERFGEIGASVGEMPINEALTSVLSGTSEVLESVLPAAMNEQWNNIRMGIEQNLLPAMDTFTELTGISLDGLSPKIASLAQGFSNFLGENGESIQGFISKGQGMVNMITNARSMVTKLGGAWKHAKKALASFNVTTKLSTLLTNAQTAATTFSSMVTTKFAKATKVMAAAQRILNAALRANPLVAIIGLVVGAGAAFLAFGSKVDKANSKMEHFNRLKNETEEHFESGTALSERADGLQFMDSRQKKQLYNDFNSEIQSLQDNLTERLTHESKFDLKAKEARVIELRGQIGKTRGDWAYHEQRRVLKQIDEFKEFQKQTQDLTKHIDKMTSEAGKVKQSYLDSQMAGEGDGGLPELTEGSSEIAAGGKKHTNINVSLEKMIETLEVHADTLDESLDEMETKVKEVFLRILNSANYAAQ